MGSSKPGLALTRLPRPHPEGPARSLGSCFCTPRWMGMYFQGGRMGQCEESVRGLGVHSLPCPSLSPTPGREWTRAPPRAPRSAFCCPKPHSCHTPDSCVTVGQAASRGPLTSHLCDGGISLALLLLGWGWGLHPRLDGSREVGAPMLHPHLCPQCQGIFCLVGAWAQGGIKRLECAG